MGTYPCEADKFSTIIGYLLRHHDGLGKHYHTWSRILTFRGPAVRPSTAPEFFTSNVLIVRVAWMMWRAHVFPSDSQLRRVLANRILLLHGINFSGAPAPGEF